jgi:predicted CoA-substrate-specific enzyme activase
MNFTAGLDIGSVFTKAVIAKNGTVASHVILPSGGSYRNAAQRALEEAIEKAGISREDIALIVTTGYGASVATVSSQAASELSCQGKGIGHLFPSVRTIIEVGGQASKVVKINNEGKVTDFAVSERCAAGSGRFLQVIARVLGIDVNEIGELSLRSTNKVKFSTSCAVFAETETISRVAEGASKEDILAGLHEAMANKILNLLQRVRMEKECALTGGGARDIGLVKAVEEKIGFEVLVPSEPFITSALGAALIAQEAIQKAASEASGATSR